MTLTLIILYLWAAFWVAMIAGKADNAPKNQFVLVLVSIFFGLIWPFSLVLIWRFYEEKE